MDWKQELLKRLDALASSLGTTAAHMWAVLVRQGIVEGMADAAIGFILLLLAYLFFSKAFLRGCRQGKANDWDDGGDVALATIGGIVSSVLLAFSLGSLYVAIQELLNPEYYALSKILEHLGK